LNGLPATAREAMGLGLRDSTAMGESGAFCKGRTLAVLERKNKRSGNILDRKDMSPSNFAGVLSIFGVG